MDIDAIANRIAGVKLRWRVQEMSTGRWRSFNKRGWPSADYPNDLPAVNIHCEDAYEPRNVDEGKHAPLTVMIADYSRPSNPTTGKGFTWVKATKQFATLEEAKRGAERILQAHPQLMPKEYQ